MVTALSLDKTYFIALPSSVKLSLFTTWIPQWIKGLLKAPQVFPNSIHIDTEPCTQPEHMAHLSSSILFLNRTCWALYQTDALPRSAKPYIFNQTHECCFCKCHLPGVDKQLTVMQHFQLWSAAALSHSFTYPRQLCTVHVQTIQIITSFIFLAVLCCYC